MNRLLTLAEQIRSHYLLSYLSGLEKFRALTQPSAAEVMLEMPGEAALAFRLNRADFASQTGGEFHEVNVETYLEFEPFRESDPSGMELTVFPLTWNSIEFRGTFSPDTQPIEGWALKWLDRSQSRPADSHGLSGVIHSVNRFIDETGAIGYCVDFGSASVQALSELLDVLNNMGATRVEVSSSCLA